MTIPFDELILERLDHPEAAVGMISLPLPRALAGTLALDAAATAMQPLAWWERHTTPRRALAFVLDEQTVPETLRVRQAATADAADTPSPWTVEARITREQLDYVRHPFTDIASLRGVPAEDCTTVEYELLLDFGGRTLSLQCGATGPAGGPYWWQNVQVDRLWRNEVVEAVRVGGVIYNADTYLWGDLYLLLFANGVVQVAAHFVNTRLHIEGYDFQGLPVIRFAGEGIAPVTAALPQDGSDFDLGVARLNTADAEILCSAEHPGRLESVDGDVRWYPVDRTFNPQWADAPETEWAVGAARTVRFHLSLSAAPAAVARYRAPSWWYAVSGEPWPWPYLPVQGRYARMGECAADYIRGHMTRGRFDGGSADFGNDGFAGIGLMQNYYQTGRADLQADALDYCYFWADLMVDHTDFTIHQWVGGWGWKTCAYAKFRDILYGYLETGDPYLQDTVENCAEAYWFWFRANWPRSTIGRDAFELGGWAMLWRFFRSEHARERTRELLRMLQSVLDARGVVGGQMGAGPHPGYLPSLYMTGVCMNSLLEIMEAEVEAGAAESRPAIVSMLERMASYYLHDDVELFPSNFREVRAKWGSRTHKTWAVLAMRVYPELIRLHGHETDLTRQGLAMIRQSSDAPVEEWPPEGRPGDNFIYPRYHDALMLGAQLHGDGILLAPIGDPALWEAEQVVSTPFGPLTVTVDRDERTTLRFHATRTFPVTVQYAGQTLITDSQGACALP